MQVHREQAVDAGGLEHARDEARGDRLARRRLLVLARVAVPRGHGDHAVRRRADGRVDHDHELHQRVVRGEPLGLVRAGGLDDEEVGAADRVLVLAVDLAVGERLEARVGQVDAELLRDLAAELHAGPAGGDHQPLVVAERDAPRAVRPRACVSTVLMSPSSASRVRRNPRRSSARAGKSRAPRPGRPHRSPSQPQCKRHHRRSRAR